MFNFYSSGEEVLAEHPNSLGDPSIIDIVLTTQGLYLGKYAWALQEKMKGRIHDLQSYPIVGSVYGGWGFTQNIGHPPHVPSQTEAAALSESQLRSEPVFDPGFKLIEYSPSPEDPAGHTSVELHGPSWIADLTDPIKGHGVAAAHLNTLLAEMFPAKTLAVGLTPQPRWGEAANFNMQERFKAGWPSDRSNQDWRHSDIKQVTYSFIYPAFDSIVQLGQLAP